MCHVNNSCFFSVFHYNELVVLIQLTSYGLDLYFNYALKQNAAYLFVLFEQFANNWIFFKWNYSAVFDKAFNLNSFSILCA